MSSNDASDDDDDSVVVVVVAVGSSNPCKIEAVRSAFEETFNNNNNDRDDVDGNGALNDGRRRRRPVEIVVRSFSVDSGVSDQPFGDAETKLGATNRARAAFEACTMASSSQSSSDDGDLPHDMDGHRRRRRRRRRRGGCDFAVGLEGGIELVKEVEVHRDAEDSDTPDGGNDRVAGLKKKDGGPVAMWCMAWMAILGSDSGTCTLCRANGSSYVPPPPKPSSRNPEVGGGGRRGREVWGYGRTGSFLLPPRVASLVNRGMELGHADDEVFDRIDSKRGSGTVGVLTDGMIDRSSYYDHAIKLALVPWIRPELYIDEARVDGGDNCEE